MKPRIKMGDLYVHMIGGNIIGWWCEGGNVSAFGATPAQAYQFWKERSPGWYSWPNGAVVEQHTCPPKPTLWQRIKRTWQSFDCSVIFDRVY